MSDSPGTEFGRYVLLDRVGAGGMAEVFRAVTKSLGGFEKTLAIKRLFAHYSEDQNFVHMLLDEARIAALFHHAAIAQVYDVGVVGSNYYIAMEFVEGHSAYNVLKTVYSRKTHVPIALACHITVEVCSALHHAHRFEDSQGRPLGIVHRDVSPQNVLVSYDGDVKVVDFGIAKGLLRSTKTQSGVIKGKFYYMAPEQARGENVDHRADIFSAGILLYELLTTHPCYDQDDNAILFEKVKNARIIPPRRFRPTLPEELEKILSKALALNPDERYQTADEFAWAVCRFLKEARLHPTRLHLRKYMLRLFGEPPKSTVSPLELQDTSASAALIDTRAAATDDVDAQDKATQIVVMEDGPEPELHPAANTGDFGMSGGPTQPPLPPALPRRSKAFSFVLGMAIVLAIANLVVLVASWV